MFGFEASGWFLKQLLCHGQAFLMYPAAFVPRPRYPETPSGYGLEYNDVRIQTSDRVTLSCYLIEKEEPRATVLMFQGNAMCQESLMYQAHKFYALDCNVLAVSYRGFGASGGVPSEKGLQKDAQAALGYILNHERLSKLPIIVYGLSLGGAVAIDVVSKNANKITALIIENTYTSVPDYVRDWDIIGPFSFLSTNRWNSGSKIFHIPPTLPIMFCSGRRDRLIRPVHMDNLWELAKQRGKKPGKSARRWFSRGVIVGKSKEEQETEEWTPPKGDKFIEFLAGDFSNTHRRSVYWSYVKDFMDQCLPPPTQSGPLMSMTNVSECSTSESGPFISLAWRIT